jgi:hypothetical protein
LLRTILPALFLLFFQPDLHAQTVETIVIPPDPVCLECFVQVELVVSLGEEDGEGFLDFPRAAAVSSDHYFIVNSSLASEIRVFDLDGRFERVLGRAGEGPGEYRVILGLNVSKGDSLHVTDMVNLRRTVLSPDLEVARSHRLPTRPVLRGCLPLEDGGCLLNGMVFTNTGKMRLLHRLDVNGKVVRSFSDSVPASIEMRAGPTATVRTPVLMDETTIIAAHLSDFILEEHDLGLGDPRRLFLLTDRDWRSNTPTAPPGTYPGIMDVRVDDQGRLWLLVRVGDPNWEEVVEQRRPGLGRRAPPKVGDLNGYWDSVIEVIDLETRRVLARERLPQYFTQFLESGDLVGFRITQDYGAVVEVYDLQLRGEGLSGQ